MSTAKRTGKSNKVRITRQVRYKGLSVSQTFSTIGAADKWERRVKTAKDDGTWPLEELCGTNVLRRKYGFPLLVNGKKATEQATTNDDTPDVGWSLKRALEEYARTIDREKGSKQKLNRIKDWIKKEPDICARRLDDKELPSLLQGYIRRRSQEYRLDPKDPDEKIFLSPNTIRNDIFTIGALYSFATRKFDDNFNEGWDLPLESPTKHLKLPPQGGYRDRRLRSTFDGEIGEEERLLAACDKLRDGEDIRTLLIVAIDTAMRLSELLDIRSREVQITGNRPRIIRPDSKSGKSRNVLLSPRAYDAVKALMKRRPNSERLFTFDTAAVEYRWKRLREFAEIDDLTFHDLRHEGLSRLAAAGLSVFGIMQMSGHATLEVLRRYIKHSDEEIAQALGW